ELGDGSPWAARLFDTFLADLADASGSNFLSAFDSILRAETISRDEGAPWQDVLSAMRRRIIHRLVPGEAAASRAEDIWHEARIWQSGSEVRVEARRRLFTQRRARILGEIGAAFITAFDIDALISAV